MGIWGNDSVTSIVNYFSAGGIARVAPHAGRAAFKSALSGALTATTYLEIVGVSGKGVLNLAVIESMDATSRAIGLKIVVDGTIVFDAASTDAASANTVLWGCGVCDSNAGTILEPVPFTVSLSLQVKSSLSETDKVKLFSDYFLK